jgi:hypothetical protein
LITVPRRKSLVLSLALAAALLAGVSSPSSAFLDKTRFVAHLGVAYFCFHHWVLKPFQDGAFNSGAPHRISSIVKAGAALLFAVHEVKVADKIAKTSNDPLLAKLDGGLTALTTQFDSIGTKLKSGSFDPKDITSLNSAATGYSSQAAADGTVIKDVPIPNLDHPSSESGASSGTSS